MDVADVISTSGRAGEALDEAVLDMVDKCGKERQRIVREEVRQDGDEKSGR